MQHAVLQHGQSEPVMNG